MLVFCFVLGFDYFCVTGLLCLFVWIFVCGLVYLVLGLVCFFVIVLFGSLCLCCKFVYFIVSIWFCYYGW